MECSLAAVIFNFARLLISSPKPRSNNPMEEHVWPHIAINRYRMKKPLSGWTVALLGDEGGLATRRDAAGRVFLPRRQPG
jgi:hypothetical protein